MSRPLASTTAEIRRLYPGLRPFSRDEADRFFGREEQIDQLLDKLAETHFLAVLGTSGSGKSSLVRAGLLPALGGVLVASEPSGVDAEPRWSVAGIRPGDRPFHRLAVALVHATGIGRGHQSMNGTNILTRWFTPGAGPPPRQSCAELAPGYAALGSRRALADPDRPIRGVLPLPA